MVGNFAILKVLSVMLTDVSGQILIFCPIKWVFLFLKYILVHAANVGK
jgi:hypothetical protein